MKLSEILAESISLETTVRSIVNDISTPVSDLFGRIKYAVQRAADNNGLDDNGNIVGLGLIIGGEGSRWMETYWHGKLHNDLYDLSRFYPKYSKQLQELVSSVNKKSFSGLSKTLPEILSSIGNSIHSKSLISAANQWRELYQDYLQFVEKVTIEADRYGADPYSNSQEKQKPENVISKQNAEVEKIINDTLGRIDRHQAGEIRNILSRSANKLATLQQELNRRGIRL